MEGKMPAADFFARFGLFVVKHFLMLIYAREFVIKHVRYPGSKYIFTGGWLI
jgi:hypothetical protein